MQCPQCQHANPAGLTFCNACGTLLSGHCTACDFTNQPGSRFCGACGTSLTAHLSVTSPVQSTHRGAEAESRFQALLAAVMWVLQRDKRVPYRTLAYVFGIDEAWLQEIREDLSFRRLAIDEDGKGLVWIGETHSPVQLAAITPVSQTTLDIVRAPSPAAPTLPPAAPEATTPSPASPMASDGTAPEIADDESAISEQIRSSREAERRQLTVMFCDLADSTKLSQQLDPEDLRDVVRAYQETAADVVHQYEGHIAQYLGDGLLVYFGWPLAHEDDAQRALHVGLGIVDAITTRLNPRLERV